MSTPVFFLIAGEASGDLLGARLMRALRAKLDNDVRFVGVGGPQMMAEGLDLLFPHTELMHFGVVEVLRHIPRLLARIKQTAKEVIRVKPTALITIDSPDFCFRVAKRVKNGAGTAIPLIHYVAPTVWAWRPGRAKKIARFLDHLLALLPFEPPYFTKEGLNCTFVGHSVVEGDAGKGSNAVFRSTHKIAPETPLLTVLPGSRVSEITRLLPIFHETVKILQREHPSLEIVVPTVSHLKERIETELANWDIRAHIVEGERAKFDAFAASRAALACSGTVALELALARLPSIIAYKINSLTVIIYRRFIITPYVNLINIMHNKCVVPEYLQENCTALKLADGIGTLLRDEQARQTQISFLTMTASWLGQGQFVPSERAAETVLAAVKPQPAIRAASPLLPQVILQVLPALVTGGVERGTVETVKALVQAGFKAVVASSGGPMVREVIAAGGTHITLPLKSKNPFAIYRNIGRLRNLIQAQHISLVHARSRAPAWSAFYAAKQSHISFVTTFHSAYGAGSALKRFYNSIMAKGDRIIAISNFVKNYIEQSYNISPLILRHIPRGVDIEKFDRSLVKPSQIDALRSAWNLSTNAPIILMPGRLTRWKGQSILIKALAKLERRDFICVIIGGGKNDRYGKELIKEIAQHNLEKNIAIFDTCRDMPAAYSLADLVVVPSTRPEGFGRVVIEAQAMGTPVIASDHGGARETVIPGQTGWLTSPGNSDELAHRIDAVLKMTPAEKQTLATRAVTHIRENLTTEKMTNATLAVYSELLSNFRT